MRPAFRPLRARLWENAVTVIDELVIDKLVIDKVTSKPSGLTL
jgi:hypothetical protein